MHYERLSANDTAFLRIETPDEPQHVGSLAIFEGPPLRDLTGRVRIEELRRHIHRRLPRVPRLRQRLMDVPYGQGRPVWVDDGAFDLEYHVRLTALPRPGDADQLDALMGRLQSQALDRDRPLWELWFVDGLGSDEVGMVIKTHHALGDGIANVDLALALVDTEADPDPDDEAPAWRPRPAPTPNQLLVDSVRDQLAQPARLARRTVEAVRNPAPVVGAASNLVKAVTSMAAKPDPTPWNLPVSRHRRWVRTEIELVEMRQVRERWGATINDLVLAACTGALRQFLEQRGEYIEGRVLKAMVPISLRGEDERGDTLGNLVALVLVDLPVDEPDVRMRLERIHTDVRELRDSGLVEGGQLVTRIADGVTPLAAPLTRFVARSLPMNLVITNVPGPPMPLYLRGARLMRAYPYVEVVDNEGLTIAVVSYDDRLHFGITSDRDVIPDLEDLGDAIAAGFRELADSV